MSERSEKDLAEALGNCAREPVHAPGAIQDSGCLVCVDAELQEILQVSANIADFLGVTPDEAFDLSPGRLLGRHFLRQLMKFVDKGHELPLTLTWQRRLGAQSGGLQATVYRSDGRWVFEIEPIVSRSGLRPLTLLNGWLREIARVRSPEELLSRLVEAVDSLTGFDRIMIYRFDEQWHGTVVSETRRAPMESFLGHRFPAADIPSQVRALYTVNPVRSIPDSKGRAIALISRKGKGGGPLDMGPGYLRACSPVHLRYLANMKVGASLSVALHSADGLWGLLACHHASAKPLSPQMRDTVLAVVQMASQRLFLLETAGQMRYVKRVLDSRVLFSCGGEQAVGPDRLVREHGREWMTLFDACGVALISRFGIARQGMTPDEPVLGRIASALAALHPDGPWSTDRSSPALPVTEEELAGCLGLLALPMNVDSPPGWFLLFRQELHTTLRWAGAPEHVLVKEKGRKVLTPRHSFATWVEEVKGKSRPWLPIEVQAAQDLAEDLTVAVSAHHIAHLNGELQAVNKRLQSLAHTDSLTGVWNRYHMEESIDAEISAAQRYQRSCSLLLFDIDHFKQFNDSHGHDAGDQVLKVLTVSVGACLRAADHFGRWGGEEFLILTGVEVDGAVLLAERIRRQVEKIDLGGLGQVTVSIGVSGYRAGDSRKQLVARADQAMYRAKEDGRNRVVCMS